MTESNRNTLIGPIAALGSILVLGGAMLSLQPEKAGFWIAAMAFLPVMWALTEWHARGRAGRLATLRYSITGAGMMIALPLAAQLANLTGFLDFLSEDMRSRSDGMAFGVFLLIYGNFMPKRAVPLDAGEVSAGAQQSMNLHTGLILMLMGITTILITGFAPSDLYNPLTLVAMAIGSVAILRRAVQAKKQGA